MMMLSRATMTLTLLLGTVGACSPADDSKAQTDVTPACDRACLIKMTDRYLAALAAHDPKAALLAADAQFVENAQRIQAGEGLWATTTSGPTAFSIHVPDEANQTAGWVGMMEQDGKPVEVAIRLVLADGKVKEAEHRVSPVREEMLVNLRTPRTGLVSDVPADARLSHDELIAIGGSYYDALDDNDGSKMPFAADCQRQENGMITSGAGAGAGPNSDKMPPIAKDCAGQLSSGVMAYITTIGDRQVFAADPQTGLAMGFSVLRHPMDFEPYEVTGTDGTKGTVSKEMLGYEPWDNVAAHIWKIGADHKVHEIEAMGFRAPSEVNTLWADMRAPDRPQ